jgi:hypothetical protein
MSADETPERTVEYLEGLLDDWRASAYYAEKWLSRLLGISLNQVGKEAENRIHHPLGADEEWRGSHPEWVRANIRILEGALVRLKKSAEALESDPKRPCDCADCRGVWIDLDKEPADVEGHASPKGGSYTKVAPDGTVLP